MTGRRRRLFAEEYHLRCGHQTGTRLRRGPRPTSVWCDVCDDRSAVVRAVSKNRQPPRPNGPSDGQLQFDLDTPPF